MVLLCCDFLRGVNANAAAPTKRVKVVKIGCAQSAESNSQAFSATAHKLRHTAPICGSILPYCLLMLHAQLKHALWVCICMYVGMYIYI